MEVQEVQKVYRLWGPSPRPWLLLPVALQLLSLRLLLPTAEQRDRLPHLRKGLQALGTERHAAGNAKLVQSAPNISIADGAIHVLSLWPLDVAPVSPK